MRPDQSLLVSGNIFLDAFGLFLVPPWSYFRQHFPCRQGGSRSHNLSLVMLRLILQALCEVLRILLNHGGLFRSLLYWAWVVAGLGVAEGNPLPLLLLLLSTAGWQQDRDADRGRRIQEETSGEGHSVNPSDAQTLPLRNQIPARGQFQRMGMLTLDKVVGRVLVKTRPQPTTTSQAYPQCLLLAH
jgi:hypothetical protein